MTLHTEQIITLQIKSTITFIYLHYFNCLESELKKFFQIKFKECNDEDKMRKLHFFYGGKVKTNINFARSEITLNTIKYNRDSEFKTFSLKELITINKTLDIVSSFNSAVVESMNHPKQDFLLIDCIIKLIEMRNVISHELVDANFKTKHTIEILSKEKLCESSYDFIAGFIQSNVDIDKVGDNNTSILSNYILMRKIIEKLKEEYNLFEVNDYDEITTLL